MWKSLASAALVLAATGAAAQTFDRATAERFTAQCLRETGTAGSYTLVTDGGLPRVVGPAGTVTPAAHRVNDCLKDKYQVQPGRVRVDGVTVATDDGFTGSLLCRPGALMVRGNLYCTNG